MGKILYLECNSGISGDMTVGALLDLGADQEVLKKALESLGVEGYHLHIGRAKKSGLDACDFSVHLEEEAHDHAHTHIHEHEHGHAHSHIHRRLKEINEIIDRLNSKPSVKALARRIFAIVAEAEAKAHGISVEEVHFHEVGAVDSIVDIISTAVCLDNLGIREVVISPLTEGQGQVCCQHGVIPVPVPATVNIAAAYGLTLKLTDCEGEMVTPTGAAIAAALKTRDSLPSSFRILKIGMGAGKKDFPQANVLRAILLEETEGNGQMWVLEANIDDSTGEMLGFAMEALLKAGAADVWNTPIYMKKSRPACLLSVLCKEEEIDKMEEILFTQTTTIGIRRYPVSRTVLSREKKSVSTKWGEAKVKLCTYKGHSYCYPEYESVKSICEKTGLDYQTVYSQLQREGAQ